MSRLSLAIQVELKQQFYYILTTISSLFNAFSNCNPLAFQLFSTLPFPSSCSFNFSAIFLPNSFVFEHLYSHHNNKQTLMQRVILPSQSHLIFQPIPERVVSAIKADQLCLEGLFYLNKNPSRQVKVVLTNNFIALSQNDQPTDNYQYFTPLTYELKFQVAYETDGVEGCESSIFSKRVGFRLYKGTSPSVEFTILSENRIDIWIKYLNRCLNQLGFHRLYKPVKKLGKGGFATVYEVERLTDKLHFAVKAFSKQTTLNSPNQNQRLTLLNEIKIMRAIDSPHLIKLESVFQSDNSLYVILQLISTGQLHSRINSRQGNFSLAEIRQFVVGMAKGLKEIHDNGIMHRDIKPENIMLRGETGLDPIIVDFGLAAYVNSEDYLFYRCGTPGYVAPEITTLVKGQKVDPVCDVFSTGAILHILLTKKTLFEGRRFEQVYENNRRMRFNLKQPMYSEIDPQAMDLLARMLRIDPRERIRPGQILQHPFLCGWVMECEKESSLTKTEASCRQQCPTA